MRRPDGPHRRLGLRRAEPGDDFDSEMAHHLAEVADRLVEEGWSPDEAGAEARRRFGDMKRWDDEVRQVAGPARRARRWRMGWVGVTTEARAALRALGRAPGASLATVGTLAVGLGLAAAAFSAIDAVLLRPIAYEHPDELYEASLLFPSGIGLPYTAPELREALATLDLPMMAHWRLNTIRLDGPSVEELTIQAVQPGAFSSILGVAPALGRDFMVDDADPGAATVAILSHEFAERLRRREGRENPVGSTLRLQEGTVTVIGVMPEDFRMPWRLRSAFFVPMAANGNALGRAPDNLQSWLRFTGSELVDEERVVAAEELVTARFNESGHRYAGQIEKVQLERLGAIRANPDVRNSLWMVAGGAGVLLLVAILNALNLQLVRVVERAADLRLRRVLGASTARVVGGRLAEATALAVAAGALAVLLAHLGVTAIRDLLPSSLTVFTAHTIQIETRTTVVTALLTGLSAFGIGLLPLWALFQAERRNRGTASRTTTEGSATRRFRGALVFAQVVLSSVLVVGAGLFLRSYAALAAIDPGYETQDRVMLQLNLSETAYPDEGARASLVDELVRRVSTLPGVREVGRADYLPPSTGFRIGVEVEVEGRDDDPIAVDVLPHARIHAGYLEVAETEVIEGRSFTRADHGQPVVIIDEPFARALWPDRSPIGERFRISESDGWRTVVGVVEDQKLYDLEQSVSEYEMFWPVGEETRSAQGFLIVAPGRTLELIPEIQRTVRELAPEQPIGRLETAGAAIADSLSQERLVLTLLLVLGGVALALTLIGIYGVFSYSVRRRAREIGIRMAIGAEPARVGREVVGRALGVTGVAVVVGLAVAWGLGRFIQSLLFGVTPTDPAAMAAAGLLLLGTALLASWLPARQALRVDPIEVLREE